MARMAPLICIILGLGSAAGLQGKGHDSGSVIAKVIEMLMDNKVKIADDLAAAEKEQAAYSQYCDDEAGSREYAIKTATRTMADLDAAVLDCTAQTKAADDEIATLGTEIAAKDGDIASATTVRSKEKADFAVVEKQLVTSVDQLEKAVVLIKRGSAAFIQSQTAKPKNWKEMQARALSKLLGKVIDAAWVDKAPAKALKGFLQEQEAAGDADDLSMNSKSSSGSGESILETLEEMKEKAEETLSGVRMTEMKANHNFQMMVQSLTDAVELAKQKLSDANSLKATLAQTSGKAKGELELTQKGKMADMTFLSTLKSECATAATAFAEKTASAKGEMAAIEKAKSILSEGVKVFFVQTKTNDPFADDASTDDDKRAAVRKHLVDDLKALSHKVGSFAMMELASSASQDPFEKVKGLITDMIAKLVSEANAEATQKAFCDEETAKSKKEQAEKSMRSDELTSRLDTSAASKGTLAQAIKDLSAEVADLDAKSAEAATIRAEEHATYLKASADFKMAAKAVEDAIRVLKEYYEGAGTSSDASTTIVGILETSGAEFTKMYMEVETTETEAVSAFKKMTDEDKVTKAAKLAEIKGAESEIKSLDVAIQNSGEDLKMVTKELDAVMSYLDKLKPQCETKAMTYEEKKAKREAEIEGLKEALGLLSAPELLQVSQLRGTKRH